MDDPGILEGDLTAALAGLRRLNLFAPRRFLWSRIRGVPLAPGERLRVLDVATGSGDFLRAMARLARSDAVPASFLGVDRSPRCLREASRLSAGFPEIRFALGDALADPLPGRPHVVTVNLFLHHLEDDDVVRVLARITGDGVRLGLACDLVRGTISRLGIAATARVLTRSPVVRADSVRSVRAAFRAEELLGFARAAGLRNPRVSRRFPFWLVLVWEGRD